MRIFRFRRCFAALTALALGLSAATSVSARPWLMLHDQAAVTFALEHDGSSVVAGRFGAFDADIDFNPDSLETSAVSFTIDAASVDTDWEFRDDFIRGESMLDVAAYPQITFVSKGVSKTSGKRASVTGLVTIKGVTREETFDVEMTDLAPSPQDADVLVANFVVTGQIDRTDYGVSAFAPAVATTMSLRVDLSATEIR